MAKNIDQSPISVQRIRRTSRIEVNYDSLGALISVVAHRFEVAQQSGSDVTTPVYVGTLTIQAADVPNGIANQLANLYTRIDTIDNT